MVSALDQHRPHRRKIQPAGAKRPAIRFAQVKMMDVRAMRGWSPAPSVPRRSCESYRACSRAPLEPTRFTIAAASAAVLLKPTCMWQTGSITTRTPRSSATPRPAGGTPRYVVGPLLVRFIAPQPLHATDDQHGLKLGGVADILRQPLHRPPPNVRFRARQAKSLRPIGPAGKERDHGEPIFLRQGNDFLHPVRQRMRCR